MYTVCFSCILGLSTRAVHLKQAITQKANSKLQTTSKGMCGMQGFHTY